MPSISPFCWPCNCEEASQSLQAYHLHFSPSFIELAPPTPRLTLRLNQSRAIHLVPLLSNHTFRFTAFSNAIRPVRAGTHFPTNRRTDEDDACASLLRTFTSPNRYIAYTRHPHSAHTTSKHRIDIVTTFFVRRNISCVCIQRFIVNDCCWHSDDVHAIDLSGERD